MINEGVNLMKRTLGIFLIAFLFALLVTIFFSNPHASPFDVSIDIIQNTNVIRDSKALFCVRNNGRANLKLNKYCTIYWTNSAGISSYAFYQHHPDFPELTPKGEEFLQVRAPPDARFWRISVSYQMDKNLARRLFEKIESGVGYRARSDGDSFTAVISDYVTNAALVQ